MASRRRSPPDKANLIRAHISERPFCDSPVFFRFPLETSDVRVPANQRRVHHRCRKDIVNDLRQERELLRDPLSRQRVNVVAIQLHVSAFRGAQTCQCRHCQRLAGAVLPEDCEELARMQFEVEFIDEQAPRHADGQSAATQ